MQIRQTFSARYVTRVTRKLSGNVGQVEKERRGQRLLGTDGDAAIAVGCLASASTPAVLAVLVAT